MITVVMNSWKRQANVPRIVATLDKSDLVSDILIWDNNPDVTLALKDYRGNKVRVINSSRDFGLSTRWALAIFAKNDCIMTQDDDYLVGPDGVQGMHTVWAKDQHIMHGVSGRRVAAGNKYPTTASPATFIKQGPAHMVMTGFAMVHKKYCLSYFQHLDAFTKQHGQVLRRIVNTHGDDLFMSYLIAAEAQRDHQIHRVPYKEIHGAHDAASAIYLRPGHFEKRTDLIRACQQYFKVTWHAS